MLDSWRCFFGDFLGKPINFPVDLYGPRPSGQKPGLLRGSYSGSSGVGERFCDCCIRTRVPQVWKSPKKEATFFFEHGASFGYINLKTKVAWLKGKSLRSFRNHQFGEFHAEGWNRSSAGRIPSEEDGWESAVSGPCGFHQLAWSRRLTVGW